MEIDDIKDLRYMEVDFEVFLGETNMSIKDIKSLTQGSIIDLLIPAGINSNFYINNLLTGKGEIMVFEKNLAIRINDIFSEKEMKYNKAAINLKDSSENE